MTGARERIHSPCLGHEIPLKGCTISASIHIGKHVLMCVAGSFFKIGITCFFRNPYISSESVHQDI